jgi:hypothetical protein
MYLMVWNFYPSFQTHVGITPLIPQWSCSILVLGAYWLNTKGQLCASFQLRVLTYQRGSHPQEATQTQHSKCPYCNQKPSDKDLKQCCDYPLEVEWNKTNTAGNTWISPALGRCSNEIWCHMNKQGESLEKFLSILNFHHHLPYSGPLLTISRTDLASISGLLLLFICLFAFGGTGVWTQAFMGTLLLEIHPSHFLLTVLEIVSLFLSKPAGLRSSYFMLPVVTVMTGTHYHTHGIS